MCVSTDHADKQKLIDDAMFKLEHGEKDKRKSKAAIPGLVQIKVSGNTYSLHSYYKHACILYVFLNSSLCRHPAILSWNLLEMRRLIGFPSQFSSASSEQKSAFHL